jgi:hypothetical protein
MIEAKNKKTLCISLLAFVHDSVHGYAAERAQDERREGGRAGEKGEEDKLLEQQRSGIPEVVGLFCIYKRSLFLLWGFGFRVQHENTPSTAMYMEPRCSSSSTTCPPSRQYPIESATGRGILSRSSLSS